MFYRLLFSFLLVISCTSCNDILVNKKHEGQALDTIINFKKVDVSPYFKICENLLDEAKINCFRLNIQKHFNEKLKELQLSSNSTINESIIVVLIVDKNGKVRLKELIVTDEITANFPEFEMSIKKMVSDLPKLYPALKRGIPVTTEYKLPINVVVQ